MSKGGNYTALVFVRFKFCYKLFKSYFFFFLYFVVVLVFVIGDVCMLNLYIFALMMKWSEDVKNVFWVFFFFDVFLLGVTVLGWISLKEVLKKKQQKTINDPGLIFWLWWE